MNIFKTKLWRPLALTTSCLAIFSITVSQVANEYAPKVNDFLGIQTSKVVGSTGDSYYYKSEYSDLNSMVKERTKLLVQIASEGTVLLKNESSLPLKSSSKVVVLNEDSFVFSNSHGGGAMSSSENLSKRTTLTRALQDSGLTVSSSKNDIASYDATIVVIGRYAGEGNDMSTTGLSLTSDEKSLIEEATSKSNNVIVLLSGDYVLEINDLKNNDKVKGILKFGNAGLRGAIGLVDVISGKVSPSGKLVDTYSTSTLSSPASENFGDNNFTNKNKIMASQAGKYVSYNEGIYTDYKYYETRYEDTVLKQGNASDQTGAKASSTEWNYTNEVVYPFGYGLSYSTFEKEITKVEDKGSEFEITVKVTNLTDYEAKDVVQLYFQSPYTDYDKQNKVEKASVQLVGFSKTKSLKKDESDEVSISVNKSYLASYDYTNAKTYIMDKGTYYFAIGEDSHDAINNILAKKGKSKNDGMDENGKSNLVYQFNIDIFDNTSYSKTSYTNATITNRFDDVDVNYWLEDKDKVTYLSRSDWKNTYPTSLKLTASADMISSLNDTKKYENGKWNDSKSRAEIKDVSYVDISDENSLTSGLSDSTLKTLNVTSLRNLDYNDEKWNDILDNLSLYEMSKMVSEDRSAVQAAPSVTFNGANGSDSTNGLDKTWVYSKLDSTTGVGTPLSDNETINDGYDDFVALNQNSTVYSSQPVLAATFNQELASETGRFMAEDALYSNTSFLWGLGLNLHRTCFGGRNSEYYSSDTMLNALMGTKLCKTAKEHGLIIVAKHFVINEQEQNRIGVCTFTNEQTLRENYLRVFEMVFTSGELPGVMTAYNRIGVLSCTAEYDLLTGVLREEWGSTAYVISDLNSPTAGLYDGSAAIVAGLSTFLNNGTYNATSGSSVNTSLNCENIKNNKQLLTATREACHRILYNYIHSSAINGISEDSKVVYVTPWWTILLTTCSITFGIIGGATFIMCLVSLLKGKKYENKD